MTVPASDQAGPAEAPAVKLPFKLRLKAWWLGEELLVRRKQQEEESEAAKPQIDQQQELPSERWDDSRIRLVQDVWGKGHIAPGDDSYLVRLVKPLGLNPSMSACHLGSGLGGAGRAMADAFGVWVTGLESDANLAKAGMELSDMAGMAKKAPVHHIEIDSYEFGENSLDAVFSKEILFEVKDKDRLLREAVGGLKQRGQLLITDYIRSEGADRAALDAWSKQEPEKPELWTMDEYQRLFTEMKLDIRIAEDITADFRAMIVQGWADFLSSGDRSAMHGYAAVMVDEIELWNRRVAEIDAGRLQVCRFHAIRTPGTKMLSEW